MKNVLKLSCITLMVSLVAGCSSSGGSGETKPPEFDGDLGFENVDSGYGTDAPDSEELPELGFDFGYVYIPDIDTEVPVPSHPIENNIQNPINKFSVMKERSDDEETLYSIHIGERRVGEIIINEDGITVSSQLTDKTITAIKNSEEESWQVRGADGDVKGDLKRLDNGTWLIREEITRKVFVSVVKDGQRIFIPVSEVKGALKDKIRGHLPPRVYLHKVYALKAHPKKG
ncbi:hypothetical protein [Colwellia psychrerythraea]|uniref:Lipoprotein n=1 Tax=Colwellia psychrerythraea TaxID=28229 RepID=A0A099KYF7_COLPS|nr:hypothetical protein [Colwellia psychrerythraea]KGJ94907.1 hypothetical protein GAB14E_2141 [Colwellia psychrerythraea]